MSRQQEETAGSRRAIAGTLRLRGPFLTLVVALLAAVSATTFAGFAAIRSLDQALHDTAAGDVRRLLLTTHVRRTFRSELVLLLELGSEQRHRQRELLESQRQAVRDERSRLLAELRELGVPGQEASLRVLELEHAKGVLAGHEQPRWEGAVASMLAQTEGRLGHAVAEAGSRGRAARLLLVGVATLAAALAAGYGTVVLRRVQQAEAARLALQEQLRQSQKMESVGRLAGGVAHDFNNLLTAITGYASLAQVSRDPAKLREYVAGISAAAERASALTKQLLAFSRKHVLSPVPTALDELVRRLQAMLVRIIGEDVMLEVRCAPDVGCCLVDPSQVEQVILNLVVNGRDAMPDGGRLLIEVRNATLSERDLARHPDARPGRYVLLAVTDTGVGMSREVQSRLFEPFFTTKPRGQGTGLGLSVVYGSVKQHGGSIQVDSEPGRGTTVSVYWPMVDAQVETPKPAPATVTGRGGSESILVVEDDPLVRGFAENALRLHGYAVTAAAGAEEALQAVSGRLLAPDLLLTDVVLPDRDGRLLARELTARWPGLRVLFSSGYAERLITESGRLPAGVNFLPKPYAAAGLLQAVRAAIDAAAPPIDAATLPTDASTPSIVA